MEGAAAELAARLVRPVGARWAHTAAVVQQAERARHLFAGELGNELLAAAWLHDIGYAREVARTGFHPLDGAVYLHGTKWPAGVVSLVAHHSCAAVEAATRGLTDQLAVFSPPPTTLADALCWCDMTSGPTGTRVTLEERLAEVSSRYGADHLVVRSLLRARGPVSVGRDRGGSTRAAAVRVGLGAGPDGVETGEIVVEQGRLREPS